MHCCAQCWHETLPTAQPIRSEKRGWRKREGSMEADRRGFEERDLAVAAARPENTAAGQKLLREKMTAKAAALVPLLRAKAAEIERQGRIPDEVLGAIDTAQLFRLRTPKGFG